MRADDPKYFYAVEQRFGFRNRLYRLYVGDDYIAGAYIAGNVYDELSFLLIGGSHWLVNGLLSRWKNRCFAKRIDTETRYDQIDPATHNINRIDARNFSFSSDQIDRIRFRHSRYSVIADAVGSIELTTFAYGRRKLTVIDFAEPDVVISRLARVDRRLEVEGELGHATIAERERSLQRQRSRRAAFALPAIGVLIGFLYVTGFWTEPRLIGLAILLQLFGLQAFLSGRKLRSAPSPG